MSAGDAAAAATRDRTLTVGSALAAVPYATSKVQVFRYSAATWNTHRIHYDKDYALAEGYPDVLVQSHLHGALLARYCTRWVGDHGRLLALGVRVRRYAVAGETLTVTATVSAVESLDGGRAAVALELLERRGSDEEVCVTGSARVEIPAAWLAPAAGGAR
jgi:hydroxyacyl-ACP dehydratase HTD2-like protein with hotdog domain